MAGTVTALRMTLTDVASLARVQRPVVSMWRARTADTDAPFPSPVTVEGRSELFDASQVAQWLVETEHGNNPNAPDDAAAFAMVAGVSSDNGTVFAGLTALLALRAAMDIPLRDLTVEELLDAADECDPDDACLYTEIEALRAELPTLAGYADDLVDAAYSAPVAFEKLMRDRFRVGLRGHADVALTDAAVNLVAATAIELAAGQAEAPVFVDSTSGGSDLLMGVVRQFGESGDLTLMTNSDTSSAARLVRRRLRSHGVVREGLEVDAVGAFEVSKPVVHLAQYPSPGDPALDPTRVLSTIESIVLQMDDTQRGVVIGPASVLCDASLSVAADEVRSDLLRSGRVRAITRLPVGLVKSKPRQAQALWVLGPSYETVPIADRWTMVADIAGHTLTPVVVQDLISDLIASLGDRATVHAHSFRFARTVLTRALLAGRGSLVEAARSVPPKAVAFGAGAAIRAEELLRALSTEPHGPPLGFSAQPGPAPQSPKVVTIHNLLAERRLRYIPGNRLDTDDIADNPLEAAGIHLIGVPEVLGQSSRGSRWMDPLLFATHYEAGRLTEPGDVVFCTTPKPSAIVDTEGSSIVEFPCRVLRLTGEHPAGLHAEIVAADINTALPRQKQWRLWQTRRVPASQHKRLDAALKALREQRAAVNATFAHLNELNTLIMDGVTDGSIALTDDTVTTNGAH